MGADRELGGVRGNRQYLLQLQSQQPNEFIALLPSLPDFIKSHIPKSVLEIPKTEKPKKTAPPKSPRKKKSKPPAADLAVEAKLDSTVQLLNLDPTPATPPPQMMTCQLEEQSQPMERELLVRALETALPPPPPPPRFHELPSLQVLHPDLIEALTQAKRVPSLPPNQWKPAAEAAWRAYFKLCLPASKVRLRAATHCTSSTSSGIS